MDDPTPGTSLEDETLHSHAVAAGGGHSRYTIETDQPGVCLILIHVPS